MEDSGVRLHNFTKWEDSGVRLHNFTKCKTKIEDKNVKL